MKRTMAWMVGAFLIAVAAPLAVYADEGETARHSEMSQQGYDVRYYSTARGVAVPMLEPGMSIVPGTRVYYVMDDPKYDLSGAGNFIYLVDDGSAVRAESGSLPAAFVAASAPREVLTVRAEYPQQWMWVAAGDRPVRRLTTPRAELAPGATVTPTAFVFYPAGGTRMTEAQPQDEESYRQAVTEQRRTYARKASKARKTHRGHAAAAVSSSARYETTTTEQRMPMFTETEAEVGFNVYQIGHSWYRVDGDTWYRSATWRGPYERVKTGTVPREVIQAHEEAFDFD